MSKFASNPVEQRAFGRRESSIEAIATVGRKSYPCVVRNFSVQGALLQFAHPIDAQSLKLRIDSKQIEAICEIRHHRDGNVGVRFVRGNVGAVLELEFQERLAALGKRTSGIPEVASVRPTPKMQPVNSSELRRQVLKSRPSAEAVQLPQDTQRELPTAVPIVASPAEIVGNAQKEHCGSAGKSLCNGVAALLVPLGQITVLGKVGEAGVAAFEGKSDGADRSVPLFSYDNLSLA